MYFYDLIAATRTLDVAAGYKNFVLTKGKQEKPYPRKLSTQELRIGGMRSLEEQSARDPGPAAMLLQLTQTVQMLQ